LLLVDVNGLLSARRRVITWRRSTIPSAILLCAWVPSWRGRRTIPIRWSAIGVSILFLLLLTGLSVCFSAIVVILRRRILQGARARDDEQERSRDASTRDRSEEEVRKIRL